MSPMIEELQVFRIHTVPVVTRVVNVESRKDLTKGYRKRYAMRPQRNGIFPPFLDTTVSVLRYLTCPDPALLWFALLNL